MIIPFLRRAPAPVIGWFGKIPAVGDYTGRGMPHLLQDIAYDWFAGGLEELANQHSEHWRDRYRAAPVWHFAMNADVWDAQALIGCLAPSSDRVGRCSPLVALRSIDARAFRLALPPQSSWLYDVDSVLRRVMAENLPIEAVLVEMEAALDAGAAPHDQHATVDILTDLGIAGVAPRLAWFSWPDLPQLFAARKCRSFWWAESSPNQPARQIIHNGPPDPELFALLMGEAART